MRICRLLRRRHVVLSAAHRSPHPPRGHGIQAVVGDIIVFVSLWEAHALVVAQAVLRPVGAVRAARRARHAQLGAAHADVHIFGGALACKSGRFQNLHNRFIRMCCAWFGAMMGTRRYARIHVSALLIKAKYLKNLIQNKAPEKHLRQLGVLEHRRDVHGQGVAAVPREVEPVQRLLKRGAVF